VLENPQAASRFLRELPPQLAALRVAIAKLEERVLVLERRSAGPLVEFVPAVLAPAEAPPGADDASVADSVARAVADEVAPAPIAEVAPAPAEPSPGAVVPLPVPAEEAPRGAGDDAPPAPAIAKLVPAPEAPAAPAPVEEVAPEAIAAPSPGAGAPVPVEAADPAPSPPAAEAKE